MLDLSGLAFALARQQDNQVLGLRIQERCGFHPMTEDDQATLAWYSHLQSNRRRGVLLPELEPRAAEYRDALEADAAPLDQVDCRSCHACKLCPTATASAAH